MDVGVIVDFLGSAKLLPRKALKAALAQREEATPFFLESLQEFVNGEDQSQDKGSPLLLVIHLLAEFQETGTFPHLIKLLRMDRDVLEYVLGDATTETLPGVLISTYDGNLDLLKEMILDARVDQYVRWAGLNAMAYLARTGKIHPKITELFLVQCHNTAPWGKGDHAWVGWQSAIALLGMYWYEPVVKKAFRRGLISSGFMSFEHFREDLAVTLNDPAGMALFEKEDLAPFGSTIDTFSRWYGFSREYWEKQDRFDDIFEFGTRSPTPITNPHRNLGRNDPCHCGSGKKYKRCCLN
jgi:hypothetical protein